MTRKQLKKHLEELGLKRRQTLTLSMEDYSPDLSWEECLEIKAAEEKPAAAAASACDAPQPKRKRVSEPKESMRRRLVEHGRSRWTQEQYDSMTQKDLKDNLEELGLRRQQTLRVSAEDYNPNLSWGERAAADEKAADEKAAAAKAAKAAKAEKAAAAGQFDASGQIIPVKQQRT